MQMLNQSDQRLLELTHQHWHVQNRSWSVDGLKWYIEELLPAEMNAAKQQPQPCHTLVLLVGFSPDPLLQSIWVYRPKRILLLFNRTYWKDKAGKGLASDYDQIISKMQAQGFCHPDFVYDQRGDVAIAKQEATPDWVFRELRDRVLLNSANSTDVVIDITGAKKSMASGAFLFAGYVGAQISYVDFDQYDYSERRPLGYTCRIGFQSNPYEVLGLRDWERVQRLYEHYAYAQAATEAEEILDKIEKQVDGAEYLTTDQKAIVRILIKVLRILDEWDNGDYTVAWQQWQALPGVIQQHGGTLLPSAIRILGDAGWPSHPTQPDETSLLDQHRALKEGRYGTETSIFLQPSLLLTYTHDEFSKIERLLTTNNDYRSALLRAAGLNEFLLKARIAALWWAELCMLDGKTRLAHSDSKQQKCFKEITKYTSGFDMYEFLRHKSAEGQLVPLKNLNLIHCDGSPTMADYWNKPTGMEINLLRQLRNEAIHTHLSIPVEYAEKAKETAFCALQDYKDHWLSLISNKPYHDNQWQQPSWRDFCACCQAQFLPTSIR